MHIAIGAPRRQLLHFGFAVVLSACSAEIDSTPAATLTLTYFPGGECPLAGGEDVTFRVDPLAPESVTAIADDGRAMHVLWPPSFVGGTSDDPVVRDRAGLVVARDGQRLVLPRNGFPKLPGGWPVCFGSGSLWVQEYPLP